MTDSKTSIFVSYSHADANWLTRLQVHLKPLERLGKIELWSDTRIQAGDRWRQEIEDALNRSRIAILLISADFIASDFITNNELPPLLKAAQEKGTIILPVIVSYSSFVRTPELSEFQAVNDPSQPLESLHRPEQERILDSLHQRVDSLLMQSNPKPQRNIVAKVINNSNAELDNGETKTAEPSSRSNQKSYTLINIKNDFEIIIPLIRLSGNDNLEMKVQSESNEDSHTMRRIQRDYINDTIILAYSNTVILGRLLDVEMDFDGEQEIWKLIIQRQELNLAMNDINYNGVTPEEQAEIKARRILLNESERSMSASDYNKYKELKNFDPVLSHSSPIPILYNSNKNSPYLYDLLRLKAAISLYASLSITEIHQLEFYEKNSDLYVRFSGQRRSAYSNSSPRHIKIEGKVNLFND